MLRKILIGAAALSSQISDSIKLPDQEPNRVSAWIESDQGEKCVIQDIEEDTVIICPKSETLYLEAAKK